MAYGAFAEMKSRYRDLEALVDYREYEGEWTAWFEENWLKPRLKALGYSHVRFFGGTTFEMTGAFGSAFASWENPVAPARSSFCTGDGRGPTAKR